MAAPAAPTITSAVRSASDPTMLQVTVSVPVSGVTQMRLYERGASGAGVIIFTGMPAGGGLITVKSRYAANASVSVAASLRTADGWSAVSSYTNVSPFTVAAPNLLSVDRIGETVVELAITGLIPGAIGRIYRAAPGKPPAPIGNPWTIVGSTLPDATAPAPDGNAKYIYAVMQTRFGVNSPLSTTRQADEWWQKPPAVTLGTPTRSESTGNVTIGISHPTYTSRNRPTGIRVYRARRGAAKPTRVYRSLSASATSFVDTSTNLAHDYDYWFESINESGPSSSAPRVSVAAVREAPNPATSPSLTQLPDERFQLDWSINATTVRPITSQDIIVRTPGQTATAVFQSLGGSTTTTTLTPTANTVRQVGVLTRNAVGAAASVVWASGVMVGTPRNTDSLTGSWVAGGVQVQWSRRSSIGDELQIEFSTELEPDRDSPAEWFPLGDYGNWTTTTYSALLSGASSLVPHTFRARAIHTASGIASDWIYSARVDAQAAPHAPTMEMPTAIDATGGITLRAQHNPVDGTPVTAAQIRFRLQGSPTWITRTISNPATGISTVAAIGTNGQSLEAQGRTAGATGVYGPWGHVTDGAMLTVPLRARPTAAFTSPTSSDIHYRSQTMRIEWTASEQATASLELWDDTGGNLELLSAVTVGPDVREYAWGDIVLRDGRDYVVELIVHDGWQSSATQQVAVRAMIVPPGPPLLRATDGPEASVMLWATPTNHATRTRSNHFQGINATRNAWRGGLDPDDVQWQSMDNREVIRALDTASASLAHTPAPWTGHVWAMTVATRVGTDLYAGGQTFPIPMGYPATQRIEFPASPDNATTIGLYDPSGTNALWMWDVYLGPPGDTSYFDADTVREGHFYRMTEYGFVEEYAYGGTDPLPPTTRVEIWCSQTPGDESSWQLCGETLSDWSHHDRHPAIGVPLHYRARAYTAEGAWADSTVVTHVVDSCDAHLAWGDDWRHSAHAGWEPTYAGTGGRLHSLRRHIGPDGEYRTTVVHGPKRERETTASLTIRTADGDTALHRWEEAAETRGLVIYRPPTGRVYIGPMQGFNWDDSREEEQTVTFSVTHVGMPQ